MSKLDRSKLKTMILQEMKMLGMGQMDHMGMMGGSHMGADHDHEMEMEMPMGGSHSHSGGKGNVSREDCCAAVMCLVECCSCPVTKQALMECCADIMAGDYDH
mgnify:CR=1 FL=1